ncbi:MAG TPA: permease-like cell division protein FtsX [Polyangia bacterium]|nr:permease-like cell division protein FtsX [Polyangia bacterium]
MTRAWLLRRLVGDARRHGAVWLAVAVAFALVGFFAAGARLAARAAAPRAVTPQAIVVAYLADDLDAPGVADLRRVLATLPDVVAVRGVTARDGLERLRAGLGTRGAVLEGVGPDLLSPSLEIAVRPASTAAALAFRLRRLRGVVDVDVSSQESETSVGLKEAGAPGALAGAMRAPLALGGALGALALGGALWLLRARLGVELALLFSFGLPRAASARPARWLATAAALAGGALGLVAALLVARTLGGGPPPLREGLVGAGALVLVALVAPWLALRVPEAADAR